MANKKIDLDKLTSRFGRAYTSAKKAAERQAKVQAEFFNAIDQTLEGLVRRHQIVEFTGKDEPYDTWITTRYPGWRLRSVSEDGERLVIEEDPKFMKFTFVNKADGMVYGRTVSQSGNGLDIERLQEENPELWEQITTWPEPWFSMLREYAHRWNIDQTIGDPDALDVHIGEYLKEKGMLRTLKNPELWTEEEFAALEQYMMPGKLSTRLVPPRKATDEELA